MWWQLVINRHAVETQCFYFLRIINLDTRCGAFCFQPCLAMRTHLSERVNLWFCRESDAGCSACNCVAHGTWPVCRWCCCVLELCGQLHAPAAWPHGCSGRWNNRNQLLSVFSVGPRLRDRQFCCDARTCELCVVQTTHQTVRSSGQDAPQLVGPRFEKCVRCRSPAEAWMSWKCTLRLRNTKQSVKAVCSEHVHTLCGRNASGTYSYRCTLHIGDCCYEKRPWQICFWRFSPSSACPVERCRDIQRASTCVLAYSR